MPILRPLFTALLAASAALPASAQSEVPADTVDPTVPPALLAQFVRDVAAHPDESSFAEDPVGDFVGVSNRADLDGDGTAEVILGGTGIFCGATGNCAVWVYRALPGGGWRRIHQGGGLFLEIQEERTNGFADLVEPSHFSAFEQYVTTYAFDGERYVWSGAQKLVYDEGSEELREAFRVWSPVPERRAGSAPEPRTVTLHDVALDDAGISVSADYAACAPAAATPGVLCGRPRLVLTRTGGAPSAGGRCLTLVVIGWETTTQPGEPLCAGRGGAVLALQPTPAQWEAIFDAQTVELRGEGGTITLGETPVDALRDFLYQVFTMNGIDPYESEQG